MQKLNRASAQPAALQDTPMLYPLKALPGILQLALTHGDQKG